jgi:hypothetical protein
MTSQEASTAVDKTILRFRAFLPTAISAVALIGSVVSLWETTIKQAEVKLHVSDNIHFTRDPYGSYEVLIIPVTLANRGARDGTVLTLSLDVKNLTTNQSKRFKSAYTAEAKWFSARDDVTANLRRPKVPFAPVSVAGRSAFTGTLLFYPADEPEKKVVDPNSKLEMTLTAGLLQGNGWLDRLVAAPPPPPVTIEAEVADYLVGRLIGGYIMSLKVKLDPLSTAAAQPDGQRPPNATAPTPAPPGRS